MKPLPKLPSLWRESLAILLRRPRPSAAIAASYPDGLRFALVNGAISSILIPLVLVDFVGDIPMSFVVVHMAQPTYPLLVHLTLFVLAIGTVLWGFAVRSAQRAIPHVVCPEALWLGGGVRHRGVIPRAAIERVEPIRLIWRDWLHEHGIPMKQVTLASGFYDPPNLAVQIRDDARDTVRIGNRYRQKPPRRWVLLYADQPEAVAQAVRTLVPD